MYVDNKRDFTNPVVSSVMCHWLCPCYLRYHKQIILSVLECRTLILHNILVLAFELGADILSQCIENTETFIHSMESLFW